MAMPNNVDDYLRGLDETERALVDRVREIVRAAHPGLDEQIKWNAPSFSHRGQDRITLGLERKGGVRLVLHRGAKTQPTDGFRFPDPVGLARWPAPDRGVILIADSAMADARAEALADLCGRWVDATAGGGAGMSDGEAYPPAD